MNSCFPFGRKIGIERIKYSLSKTILDFPSSIISLMQLKIAFRESNKLKLLDNWFNCFKLKLL